MKYDRRKPIYIVMGDFNLDLEKWKTEQGCDLTGWELFPMDSRQARNLRPGQIDYALVNVPEGMAIKDDGSRIFSPFPLKVTGIGDNCMYSLCTEPCPRNNNVNAIITVEQLRKIKITNADPLAGLFLDTVELISSELFKFREKLMIDSILSKYIFDHDFLYISVRFSSMVCCLDMVSAYY